MTTTTPPTTTATAARRGITGHAATAVTAAVLGEAVRQAVCHLPTRTGGVQAGPGMLAVAFVALVSLNGVVVAWWVTDPDDTPPLAGRVALGAVLGVPLAIVELAVGVVLWLLTH
jgi:hypothetical protein